MIKAVLFDFDGVLTTDATGSQSIINYIGKNTTVDIEKFKSEYYKYNFDLLYGKTTHDHIWERLCSNIGMLIDKSLLYESFIHIPLDEKMLAILKKIKEADYKIGMVTDNKKDRMDDIISYYNWQSVFDAISVSAEIGSGKEERSIFNNILKQLNLSADECLFIDNQEKNLIVPAKLGMKVIHFNHEERNHDALINQLNQHNISISI